MPSLDYHHATSGKLVPIDDHVLVFDMEREDERVVNGIIRISEQGTDRGIRARWAQVAAIGPNQEDVKPGQWVLVEHGRWTRGIKLQDEKVYRKVENESILCVSDEKQTS